jgi:glycine amidinotransferase
MTSASLQSACMANSCDEFSPLREIVVGSTLDAGIPRKDISMWLNLFGDRGIDDLKTVAQGRFPPRIIEESEEDLAGLVDLLRSFGVRVHRPDPIDHTKVFATPEFQSEGFYSYSPRDLTLIIGSTIIETPSPMRARYFETFGLRRLLQGYLRHGSSYISAPRPRLADELFYLGEDGLPQLGEAEPAFEAANVLRCGLDLFYQVSCSGNEFGLIWLERTLRAFGNFRVHPLRDIYAYTHIDSTIALLRPGLVLLNPERITEATIPAPLRGWDVLWCPPMRTQPTAGPHPLSSPWIGMNLLMVNPGLAIVDGNQTELIRQLESRGITVARHVLRHSRLLGGGHHCVTLDTVREGELTRYCD